MQEKEAVQIGVVVLNFLAADLERLGRFLASSGMAPADLRGRIRDPEVAAGVLDFLLSDEELLTIFCDEQEIEPSLPMDARRSLPGWTPPM